MSVKKRIADLSAALTADTREYEDGMKRAARVTGSTEAQITKTMSKLETVGLKLGIGLVGSGGALGLLTSEIRNVIENIEKIPGVPATTIASVQQARYAFQEARGGVDQALASVISFTSWSARAAGFVGGALVYGLDNAEKAYWDFARAAEQAAGAQERQAEAAKKAKEETEAAARILAYARGIEDKRTSEGTAALEAEAKARETYNRRDETRLERMNRLRAEANKTFNSIVPGQSSAQTVTASAKAYDQLTEAAKIEKELTAVAKEHMKVWGETFEMIGDSGMAEAMENNRHYIEEAKSAAVQFADSVNNAFEESIIQGKRLGDVVSDLGKSILSTFVKLSVINPLMNSIFGGAKGWEKLPQFAAGGDPPVGRPSIVGEDGPELFVPRTAGTIVPNHELSGSRSDGNTYYIDARGTDASVVQRLAAALQQLAGPGVVEARALGAVSDWRMRGARA